MKHFGAAILAMAVAACSSANGGDAAEGSAEAAVREGPFGFDMGQKIEEVVGAEKLDRPGFYSVSTPPKPHPDFELVALEAYPETGICMIRGVGRDILGDGAGASIRTKVDSLADALEGKYGEPKKVDFCRSNKIKCQSQFWMMTLDDNERVYGYSWESQNEAMKKSKIGFIGLLGEAANIQDSYPTLEFESSDEDACEAARNAASADAL